MRILIDMDGVMVDTLPLWLREYNALADGTDYVWPEDIKSYGFGQYVKHEKLFFSTLEIAKVFKRALPMTGALEAVKFLRSQGHDVHFVTYNHEAAPSGFNQKLDWLHHYGLGGPADVTFQQEKSYTQGDILIEDSPENMEKWLARQAGGRGILIDHLYNQGLEHPRMVRADTILEGLKKLGVMK